MKKDAPQKMLEYVDALEKTNRHLVVALQEMHKYTVSIEKSNEELLEQLNNYSEAPDTGRFEDEFNEIKVTSRLMKLITDMPVDKQQILLTKLEKVLFKKDKAYKDGRNHARKPFFMTVDYAAKGRNYNGFIKDISAGGLFIETPVPFSVGEDIVLTFPVPNSQKHIKIIGEIVRTTEQGIGVKFKMGDQENATTSLLDTI
ncbi:MAG: PilZ domain-containing protein [Thermodesulfobacteriota bacterium]|nr:PilZ domain-containing protein [Thermodesulfobacteriota bacterium]